MSGKELFIRFTAIAFRKLLSVYVFSYLPFCFEGRMWDLIVSVPDHCLSFYFATSDCFPIYLVNAESMGSCSIRSETRFISEEICMKTFVLVADAEE